MESAGAILPTSTPELGRLKSEGITATPAVRIVSKNKWLRGSRILHGLSDSVEKRRVVVFLNVVDVPQSGTTYLLSPEIVRSSDQPKIVEMRDNLGHTFTEEDQGLSPYPVEDEVTISDDTIIKLRVTKIAAQSEDEITYSYRFLERGHRYDTHGYIPVSSWAWDLQREDYQNTIAFRINIKNDDNIEYSDPEGDDSVDIRYSNLTLEE